MTRQSRPSDAYRPDDERLVSGRRNWLAVRWAAGAELLWERFWPAVVPALIVVLAFLTVSWFGLWQFLPAGTRHLLVGVFALVFVWQLARLRHLVLPSTGEISRRVETASHLEDRPISALDDEIAFGGNDAFSRALWQEHRRRMAERLRGLTAGAPKPDANRTDPRAIRAFVALLAFTAFFYSLGPSGGRISDAFRPATDPAELRTRLDAWINPPAYTRRPPVYLTGKQAEASAGSLEIPAGSEFFLRFVGNDKVDLTWSDNGAKSASTVIAPADEADKAPVKKASTAPETRQTEFSYKIAQSGRFTLASRGTPVSQWDVTVIPDKPPLIHFAEPPTAALSGSLQLAYSVEDDYGVTKAEGEIRPLEGQDAGARPLVAAPELPLPLPRHHARSGTARVNRDLTQHPWAGSDVAITLKAHDDAGQTGTSQTRELKLPGRNFSNPLALALIEQRRILALDANKAPHVADMLDAITLAPEFIDNVAAFMAIRVAYRRVVDARNDDQLREVLDLLWETALGIEFGDMSEAERKLRDAQEKLSKALENDASDEEIAKLMDELRKAMDEYMKMLAQEAMKNPLSQNPLMQNDMMRMLRQSDLQRMMNQIENLARSGSKDAARQMLSELQRMMDNLRAGRHMQQRQAGGNQMNQTLDKLSELMRRQQELMDETFRLEQQNPQNRPNGEQSDQQNGNGKPMTPEEFADALKRLQEQQDALQQELGKLGKQLENLGLDPSEQFSEAEGEMGQAGKRLGQGQPGPATGNQAQALEALRRGVQSMMQQMAGDRQQGGQRNGMGQFGGLDRNRTDPLGRREGSQGYQDSDATKVPGEIEAQRAREIMEAIRKRLSQPASPRIEKDYLERLLETE
ncbi:MAG: TIGR02302 family protein [Salaquimonas sp.]|nr:TIGR02302 family protein [Salaquimonas sp.]